MKTNTSIPTTVCPRTLAGRIPTVYAGELIALLLLVSFPAAAQAQFTYTINNGTITITGYSGPSGGVIIPSTITGLPVTSIGDEAFESCTTMTNLVIPDSVTSIGMAAFWYCSSLTSITIGSGVTNIGNIGDPAFTYCTNLTAITVDASNPVYSSVDGVLFNKTQTTLVQCPGGASGSYAIPDTVISIRDNAFYVCTSLTSVTIPDSVTSIGGGAFEHCTSLHGVYFEGNAPSLGDGFVFYGDNATVYYLHESTGWGPTFGGLPTALWVQVPSLLTQPQTQTAEASSTAGLRVRASSPLPLFYLWYLNYTNLLSSGTNAALELTNVQFAQSGAYTVVISNALGAITSAPATLNVIAPVDRRPVPGVKVAGEIASLLNLDLGLCRIPEPGPELDRTGFRQPDRHVAILLRSYPAAPDAAILPDMADRRKMNEHATETDDEKEAVAKAVREFLRVASLRELKAASGKVDYVGLGEPETSPPPISH